MRQLLLIALTYLLVGCAGNPFGPLEIAPGTPRDAVIARMGQPTRVVRLANGERLQYSTQPRGQYAYMVDLDVSGRVTQAAQVLTEGNFNRIQVDKWTRDDIEREFGPPAQVDHVSSWNGDIMTYRWRAVPNSDMFYWVYLDPGNVVRRSHPGMEFINGRDSRK
jgi:hypothetical protein